MLNGLACLWSDEDAMTSVEYALLLATVSVAAIGVYYMLGEGVGNSARTAGDRFGDLSSSQAGPTVLPAERP